MNEKETKTLEGKAFISVRRTRIDRILQDEGEEGIIMVGKFETTPAVVTVAVGVTRSLGNYEFLRLDVSVAIPCYVEEISEIEKQASKWVDDCISSKLDEIKDIKKAV